MDSEKPWYLSTGVLAGVAVVILAIMGMDVKELDFQDLMENLDRVMIGGAGLLAAYGRLKASSKLTPRRRRRDSSDYDESPSYKRVTIPEEDEFFQDVPDASVYAEEDYGRRPPRRPMRDNSQGRGPRRLTEVDEIPLGISSLDFNDDLEAKNASWH